MQLLSVRLGLTKNLGNYESAKIEVEAAPENGQSLDDFLGKVNDFLGEQVEAAVAAAGGVKEKPAKKEKASTAAPLAVPMSTMLKGEPTDKEVLTQAIEEHNAKPATKAKPAKAAAKVNVNAPDAKKELKYALESETLDELLERFNSVRKMADQFGDKWEDAVTKIADQYRKLNSLDANPETLDAIVKAFKAERAAIEKMKTEAIAA